MGKYFESAGSGIALALVKFRIPILHGGHEGLYKYLHTIKLYALQHFCRPFLPGTYSKAYKASPHNRPSTKTY